MDKQRIGGRGRRMNAALEHERTNLSPSIASSAAAGGVSDTKL